jgi:GNAT superfamily N-acetyltransferase
MTGVRIDLLAPTDHATVAVHLADILVSCVADGASVGFLHPLTLQDATQWWLTALEPPSTLTWIARTDDTISGVVQLIQAKYPNSAHRAEVVKLLVHPRARNAGVGSALLSTVEEHARTIGRTLLLLDTQTGSPAESLYLRRGWRTIGVVDGHAATPDGTLAPSTFMSKHLR